MTDTVLYRPLKDVLTYRLLSAGALGPDYRRTREEAIARAAALLQRGDEGVRPHNDIRVVSLADAGIAVYVACRYRETTGGDSAAEAIEGSLFADEAIDGSLFRLSLQLANQLASSKALNPSPAPIHFSYA